MNNKNQQLTEASIDPENTTKHVLSKKDYIYYWRLFEIPYKLA